MASSIPNIRISKLNDQTIRAGGRYVLYWMSSARRASWNFALDRAIDHAVALRMPLLVVETLACDSPWMNPRHAVTILDGMADNARQFQRARIAYLPCVAPDSQRLERFLDAVTRQAAVVVADWYPLREATELAALVAARSPVLVESVDSNGLLPLAATDRAFPTAHAFRRVLQRSLPDHLADFPSPTPALPARFPRLDHFPVETTHSCLVGIDQVLGNGPALVTKHSTRPDVARVALSGGSQAGHKAVTRFLEERLSRYANERNQPESDASSGLSPYLHHGHVSVHYVFAELARQQGWSPDRLADRSSGSREGWWAMEPSAEAFLDELVTWREVGFNMCAHRTDYDDPGSLPDWARATLGEHAGDRRPHEYSFDEFRDGLTHDRLWNAAQHQLRSEGIIHNYLRMLWGKKILQWTPDWQTALETMIGLNNTYAVDGCDPNSYSGIFWVLGRYDRAWGPERPVFGKIRYMSSANTARKVRLRAYLERHLPDLG